MKKSNLIYGFTAIVFASILTFTACKKKEEKVNESGQASSDSRQAISENDASINDINQSVSDYPSINGRLSSAAQAVAVPSWLTVDTTGAHLGTIKLNYNGQVYNNRKREGSIRLTILSYTTGVRWKDVGCVMKVDYLGYKVTRASDGQFIEINGTQNLTNISGGTWLELVLATQPNLSSSVTGNNLSVNFNGAGIASYNINRKFTYTWANSILTCVGEGIGTSAGINNLENYGTTRDGNGFTSQVTTPILWNSTCGWGAPLSGRVNIKVASLNYDLDCLFGVNANGTPVSVGSNQCAYGWRLTWTVNSTTQNSVIGYN